MSPAEIVMETLIALGLVLRPYEAGRVLAYQENPYDRRTVCFVDSMPDDYDQAVCIFDSAGMLFGRQQRGGLTLIHPGIRLVIKALEYGIGYRLADLITDNLDNLPAPVDITFGQFNERVAHVQSIYRTSGIISLGEETGKRRRLFTVDYRIAFQDKQSRLG